MTSISWILDLHALRVKAFVTTDIVAPTLWLWILALVDIFVYGSCGAAQSGLSHCGIVVVCNVCNDKYLLSNLHILNAATRK